MARRRSEKKMKLGRFTMRDAQIAELSEDEITFPRRGGRYRGVSIGRDSDGYFVMTHRARSRSYQRARDIPNGKIKGIRSTG